MGSQPKQQMEYNPANADPNVGSKAANPQQMANSAVRETARRTAAAQGSMRSPEGMRNAMLMPSMSKRFLRR